MMLPSSSRPIISIAECIDSSGTPERQTTISAIPRI